MVTKRSEVSWKWRTNVIGWLSLFVFLFTSIFHNSVVAQVDLKYPTEPAQFVEKFVNEVEKVSTKKEVNDFMKVFKTEWEIGTFTPPDKTKFIELSNRLLEKKSKAYPDLYIYARALEAMENKESVTDIPTESFFDVAEKVYRNMGRKALLRYCNFIDIFARHGDAFKTSNAAWTFSEISPTLQWSQQVNPNTGKQVGYPELVFTATELTYHSTVDTTVIQLTKGKLNILNRWFVGNGGKIDWAKMGLDPASVYCDIKDYKLNLSYPTVAIDSVTFYYRGLLNKPLVGKFEDKNRGHRNVNKANYPSFRSYEGGVVIDNLIPNVRYEGGFSLKGIKKIGSAYYGWVDVPVEEEPEEEEEEEADEDEGEEDDYWYYEEEDDDSNPFDLGSAPEDDTPDEWGEEEEEEVSAEEEMYEEMEEMEDLHPGQELRLIPARMLIMRGDAPIMKLEATEFILDLEKLHADRTAMTLYTGEDSIYHPSLELLYEVETDEISLMKNVKDKVAHTPFISPYHNYGMYFNAIKWNRMQDTLFFTFIIDKKHQIGAIESVDFFRRARFSQFKGMMWVNPITAIHMFSGQRPGETITAEDVVRHAYRKQKRPESDIKLETDRLEEALPDLAGSGFILWNPITREIKTTEKLHKWARMARGKIDYDVIQLLSQVESGPHAYLDVNSKNFTLKGVAFFSLSDSQFVRVKPTDSEVLVKKNRDMDFGGIVAAGKLDFYGHTKGMFRFEYDNFKIFCDSLDSMRFILKRNVPMGFHFTPLQKALRNTSIEGVTGAIYINKPKNKSGKEYLPHYSIFDSYTNSYVYWARDSIHHGVYSKDKLYFSIDPFVLDSLETFDETKLAFEGEFESSEIFPRFRQRLVVMPDFTLGLQHVTPADTPMTAYEGKGSYSGEIDLDGSGLHGAGQMDFMGTTAKSDTFEFFFDSVKAVTKDFFSPGGMKEGVPFPEIRAKEVDYKWLTKTDEVELETRPGNPIVMFEGAGKFEGRMRITKEGVKAHGTLAMDEVEIHGRALTFEEFNVESKNGTLDIHDPEDSTKEHFKSVHMDVRFDVKTRKGDFATTKVGKLNIEFEEIGYKTSLGNGTYDGNTGDIHLTKSGQYAKDNYFVSTDPEQDSLRFMAEEADYNTKTRELNLTGVPFILVADAKITPKDAKIDIKQNGKMKDLEDATIECNQWTGYHKIYDATVDIQSGTYYQGEGKYDYVEVGGQDQYINLTEIKVDDTNTVAMGEIKEEEKFHLTDRIFFKGTTSLTANKKFMYFKGEVRIESSNPFFRDSWFEYEGEVNPDSVYIPVNDPKVQGKPLAVGLHFIPNYRVFYSTFLQPKKDVRKDLDLIIAKGGLTVNRITEEFIIGPKEKLKGEVYRGSVVRYDDINNTITSQGLLNFPYKITKDVWQVKFAGAFKDDMKQKKVSTDLVMALNLDCLPDAALSKLTDAFNMILVTNDDIDFHDQLLVESLAEILDEGEKEETKTKHFVTTSQTAMVSTDIKVAKELPYTFVLTDVNFDLHSKYKALHCNAEVGLLGINGAPVNKKMMAKIEYNFGKVSRTGVRYDDSLMVYLEADDMTWMWLRVYGEQVDIVTTDASGTNAELIKALEKRKKEEGFRFNFVDEAVKDEYMSRFVNRYVWGDD